MGDLMDDLVAMSEPRNPQPDFSPERMASVLEDLALRWRRTTADTSNGYFSAGRAAGYAQAIALILGAEYREVLDALLSGKWWEGKDAGTTD